MRWAFKEWAVIVDALGRGQQIIILRKGGLREGRRGFSLEQTEFWLFPTFFHQQRDLVLSEARTRFDEIAPDFPSAPVVRLQFFARVADCQRLASLASAQSLRGQHVWREEVIAKRFESGREKQIHALALRIFRLPAPVELPLRPKYSGCKSWIELELEINTSLATPVLDEVSFSAKLAAFRAALGSRKSCNSTAN